MDPFMPRRPATNPASRQEAERHMSTARDLLSGHDQITEFNINRSYFLLIEALVLDPCAPCANTLLVAAVALRATIDQHRLPSGEIDPYCVFGLLPEVPTARDPAVIESYYRQASDLLRRASHPLHPCNPTFTYAASLVADAWAVLSDPDRKASLDATFEAAPPEELMTPSQPPPTAQEDMGRRGERSVPVTSRPRPADMTATTSDVAHERRAGLRPRKRNNERVPADDMGRHGKRSVKTRHL